MGKDRALADVTIALQQSRLRTKFTEPPFREEIINKPHAKYPHGYAVVRIDLPVSQSNPEDSFAVLKVFSSAVFAEKESIRLNKVNAQKGCKYIVLVTHLVSDK